MADADELFFMAHDLGGAGHWADTIDVQWGRVLDASRDLGRNAAPGADHRLHYESYFFLTAVRQLLRVSDAYFKVTKDQRLQDARAAFGKAASDATNFRDWMEHLDAYFSGDGFMQKKGEVTARPSLSKERDGDRVVLHFDGRTLDLPATKDAARELADVTSEVWHDHAILRAPPGYRTIRRSEPPEPSG